MRPNELADIRTGDIVLVRDYPNAHDLKPGSAATKDRFAVVIGNFKDGFFSAPAQAITTKGKRTERPDYRLKENEVRLPEHLLDKRADFELTGVIKAHRFPLVSQNQMRYKVGRLPLETRLNLVCVHERIKNSPRQVAEMKVENPSYAKIMNYFRELTVAEKMGFMQEKEKPSNAYY